MMHYSVPWGKETCWTSINDNNTAFKVAHYSEDETADSCFDNDDYVERKLEKVMRENMVKLGLEEKKTNNKGHEISMCGDSVQEDKFDWLFKAFEEIHSSDQTPTYPLRAPEQYMSYMKYADDPIYMSSSKNSTKNTAPLDRFFGTFTYFMEEAIDSDIRRFYQRPNDLAFERKVKVFWE
ncbi:unnamed protein product [Bursaphelenchus okinawaensis]|uniref:Uncharacterized protein n=1 Tax=Bursaphelenchus okinawaensis TaxID=465554 RepID=A0A811KF86_9BILA|nr:unnamed protein product [Bursaphelenchus okinawaensis]CAG9102820.1 unnamed protein product [Bursaphelenchus okinawaensis]